MCTAAVALQTNFLGESRDPQQGMQRRTVCLERRACRRVPAEVLHVEVQEGEVAGAQKRAGIALTTAARTSPG